MKQDDLDSRVLEGKKDNGFSLALKAAGKVFRGEEIGKPEEKVNPVMVAAGKYLREYSEGGRQATLYTKQNEQT